MIFFLHAVIHKPLPLKWPHSIIFFTLIHEERYERKPRNKDKECVGTIYVNYCFSIDQTSVVLQFPFTKVNTPKMPGYWSKTFELAPKMHVLSSSMQPVPDHRNNSSPIAYTP